MDIYCDDYLVHHDELAQIGSTHFPFDDTVLSYDNNNNYLYYSSICDIPMKNGIYSLGFPDLPVEEQVEIGDSHFFVENVEYDCLYYECCKLISIERGLFCKMIIAPVFFTYDNSEDNDDMTLYKVDIWIHKDSIGKPDLPKR